MERKVEEKKLPARFICTMGSANEQCSVNSNSHKCDTCKCKSADALHDLNFFYLVLGVSPVLQNCHCHPCAEYAGALIVSQPEL